jgi:putative DNA-invertase from lambdoid prophage Rac
MDNSPVIAAYVRVSKNEINPENQRIALKKHFKRKEWTNILWYEDCISGLADKRPSQERLIRDVRNGDIDIVIFFSLSRFERRGVLPTLQLLSEFDRRSIPYISLTEPIDTLESPWKELIISVLASIYHIEVLQISERTKAGLERARRDGKTLGRPRKKSKGSK